MNETKNKTLEVNGWCNWFKCPKCKKKWIQSEHKYCPNCKLKLKKDVEKTS